MEKKIFLGKTLVKNFFFDWAKSVDHEVGPFKVQKIFSFENYFLEIFFSFPN